MEVKMIEYKNKKIHYVDYRGAKTEEDVLAVFRKSTEMQKESSEMYDALVNCEGVNISTENFVKELKNTFKDTKTKTAIVGVSGVMETVSRGIASFSSIRNVRMFKTEEEAKEWLVK